MEEAAIICLGNRFVAGDDIGSRVYDHLSKGMTSQGLDVIDGGLCGLDLLRAIEGRRRVVFVDAVVGLVGANDIAVLDRDEVAAYAGGFGHGAGLPYLLHMMPHACLPPWPEIAMVGTPGGATDATVAAVAQRCMEIARRGHD